MPNWERDRDRQNLAGFQCAEVSSSECAICLGGYEDDVGKKGEL